MTIQIPALCFGDTYYSLSNSPIIDLGTSQPIGQLGLVLENRIAADCLQRGRLEVAFQKLRSIPVRQRIAMCVKAADIFANDVLDGGGVNQSLQDYIEILCRVSGLSWRLAKANTNRLCAALQRTEEVLKGLTCGLPLEILDTGYGEQHGAKVRITPRAKALGCLMPNNSPGVNVTWISCLGFGIPVLIRPGSAEPFTPYRLIQSFIKAGFPREVFGYYPCDHSAANRIPDLTKAAIVFGSDDTVRRWAGNPLIELHGSGFSKLIIGEDRIENWRELLPELVENVATNSGRSCYTVSRINVPKYGDEIAEALAAELAKLVPKPVDDPEALLSAMAMPDRAKLVDASIDESLKVPGAVDVSARHRTGKRLVQFEGRTYLLPTVIRCETSQHPLANEEFLFPFVAVVESSNDQAFQELGPTLSLAVYTDDEALKLRARQSSVNLVSVNVGTSCLDRTQPHEGNLFHLLYHRSSYVE